MLLSSWGRVTQRKTLQHLSHPVSTSCSSTTNVSRPFAPCTRTHRRRNSSSKSSNPQKDDPTTIAASPQAVTEKDASAAAASTATPKKRLSTRISRQRSKDALEASSESRANALATRLPNVPSTQHLHIQDVHVASFFSIHRPISVTASIPHPTPSAAFSSIFDPRPIPRTRTATEVIQTLTSVVSTMEKATSLQQSNNNSSEDATESDFRTAVTRASASGNGEQPTHLDPTMVTPGQPFHLDIKELARSFRPFVAPPPPVPLSSSASSSSSIATQTPPSVILNLEWLDGDSDDTSSSLLPLQPLIDDHIPPQIRQPFLEHMWIRQGRWEESRRGGEGVSVWRAISVKRQRRLKMKKHKYKKLMRRTRNLRRRLDKL